MVEAFTRRLQQLYPDPGTEYSFGRVVTPPGLKPDVYVHHSDGRQWAFEMVHGNKHADHLIENHARYSETDIVDHWILWEELAPRSGKEAVPEQGIMPLILGEQKTYELNALHQAILGMQPGYVRHLYVFTINPFRPFMKGGHSFSSSYLQTIMIGVDIYSFAGWNDENQYSAECDYVPVTQLEFADDGSLVAVEEDPLDEIALQPFLKGIGLDDEGGLMLLAAIERLESTILDADTLRSYQETRLISLAKDAEPEELAELETFFAAAKRGEVPAFSTELEAFSVEQLLDDPGLVAQASVEGQRLLTYLDDVAMPRILRRWIETMIAPVTLAEVADLMDWKSQSEVLRKAQDESDQAGS